MGRGAHGDPQPRRRRGARRRRGRLRRPRARRHAARVRLRAARPRRARPDARRDRPRARRQGRRARASTSSPASARSSSSRWSTWRWTRPATPASPRSIAPSLVKPARDGGHRLPRPGRRRRLPDRGRGPLPRRHLRGADGGLPLRRDPRRRLAARCATPRFSPCFRKEAGSHGKDTRGIIRVHWFDKVEMFVYTTVEESYAEHQRLLAWEKEFLDKLELAYRVIDTAAGDLGPERRSASSTARRGSPPRAVPRAHLDLQLHRLPGPPPRHPRPRGDGRHHARRHAQRHPVAR